MSNLRHVVGLFSLIVLMAMWSGAALAQQPRNVKECPATPGKANEWPYELRPPLHAKEGPAAPTQIIDIVKTHHDGPPLRFPLKHNGAAYCLYQPPADKPAQGLILLLHGWQAGIEIGAYDAFAQFLADKGYYVVYPYIAEVFWDTGAYPQRARAALAHAVAQLDGKGEKIENVAIVGHSLGGMAAVRLAVKWKPDNGQTELPKLRALVILDSGPPTAEQLVMLRFLNSVFPFALGDTWGFEPSDLAAIDCTTRLLMIEAQTTADGTDALTGGPLDPLNRPSRLWKNLAHIAKYTGQSGKVPQRNYLRIPHDESHGPKFKIRSTHLTPNTTVRVICNWVNRKDDDEGCSLSSMDEWGYWRPTLAAVDEAFTGKPAANDYSPYCSSMDTTGTCATTRAMGVWKDGVPATPMKNAAEIPELATTFPDYCPQ